MILNRTQNAVRNIIWGVVERITLLLLPFITRTVLIKVLGIDYLGLNTLFVSILQVLSVSELGIGSAIVFSMYKPIADDDNNTLCALLNLYRKIYHIVGSAIFGLGLLLIPFLPHLVKGSIPSDVNLYSLYIIFLFNTVISYFLFSYKTALFSAFQRNDIQSKRNSVISLFSNITQIILLCTVHNYYAYVFIIPVATILTNLINAYYAKKMYPDIVCKGTISKNMKDGIKKRIIGLLSFKIYNVVFASTDAIIISAFLGLKSVALYNNYMVIINVFIGFLAIIDSSLTAGIGNKMVCESKESNYIDFKNYMFAFGWVSSFFVVLLLSIFQNFITVWLGKEFLLPISTVVLLLFSFMLSSVINTTVHTYRQAAGLWWEDRFRPVVLTITNLTLSLILIQYIGMNGVILATIFCTLFITIPWGGRVLFKNYFQLPMKEYYCNSLLYAVTTIFTGFACYVICNVFITENSLISLILKIIISAITANIIFWSIYMHKPEYKNMVLKFVKIKHKYLPF